MNAAATDTMVLSRAYSTLSAAVASSGRWAVRLGQEHASQSGIPSHTNANQLHYFLSMTP